MIKLTRTGRIKLYWRFGKLILGRWATRALEFFFMVPQIKEKPGYIPTTGNEFNPYMKFPRNETCYCGSGLKFKKCCLPEEPMAINSKTAAKAKPLIKKVRKQRRRKLDLGF